MAKDNNIPCIIHYCWFGGKEKPKIVKEYINTWKDKFPNYVVKEWNENNFDINSFSYVKQAYKAKKYAFVSDVARVWALYNEGGIYFDTDIEVLKNFENLISEYKIILCNESEKAMMTGFMACEAKHTVMKTALEFYQRTDFIKENGEYKMDYPNTYLFRDIIKKQYGISFSNKIEQKDDLIVYPREYFTAYNSQIGKNQLTENSVSVHHMNASWNSRIRKIKAAIRRALNRINYYFNNTKVNN